MIKKILQNYDWMFKENFSKSDLTLNYFNGFKKVQLPHTNKEVPLNNFDETISHITSIYKKIIDINDISKRYILTFEGVAHYGQLYVNGVFISEHKCGYTRWSSDISKQLILGKNEIAVIVDSHEINQPPFGFVIDYLCFGGIYREAYLEVYTDTYFDDYYFHYDKEKWYFDYHLINPKGKINLKLIKDDIIIVNKTISTGDILSDILPKLELWDIDKPTLYHLHVEIINDCVLDTLDEDIGFRYAEFKENGFYLNGRKVKIRGLNRHQSYPYVGYAMPKRAQYEDADLLKYTLACNAVRTSHYPQSPDFLSHCDKIGLMVFEEIPGWQNIGDEAWQDIALKNVQDMILRDRHHPSIILWGVRINESRDYHELYVKTNALAHKLDPYRQTGGVRHLINSEILEDVYTFNDFICGGKDLILRDKSEVTPTHKPYLITEYCGHMYPTKSFDNETRRTNVAKIHANILIAASKDDKIAGSFGWCFADYNTHRDFGSGDLICYHGVMDIFRNPKYSAYPYMSFSKEPFLEVTSNFNIGEYDAGLLKEVLICTNCEKVEMYHGEELINTFYTSADLSSRCFVLSDFLGNVLQKNHNKSDEEASQIKTIIKEIITNNGIFTEMLKNKYGISALQEAWNYYGKYVACWGYRPLNYTFKGYMNNKLCKEIVKGRQYLKDIKVSIDTTTLYTKSSYDVAKVTLEAIGTLSNKMEYAQDAFQIKTEGDIELIGDNIISLIAGIRSFYIKSTSLSGKGTIYIESSRFTFDSINIDIINEELI